jgi:hypothetical protein
VIILDEDRRCPGFYRKDKRCTGKIEEAPRSLFAEGQMPIEVYACDKCGRLYYENGFPVVNNDGAYAILVEESTIFIKGTPFRKKE